MFINLKIILSAYDIQMKDFSNRIGVHPNNLRYLDVRKTESSMVKLVKEGLSKITGCSIMCIDWYMKQSKENLQKLIVEKINSEFRKVIENEM